MFFLLRHFISHFRFRGTRWISCYVLFAMFWLPILEIPSFESSAMLTTFAATRQLAPQGSTRQPETKHIEKANTNRGIRCVVVFCCKFANAELYWIHGRWVFVIMSQFMFMKNNNVINFLCLGFVFRFCVSVSCNLLKSQIERSNKCLQKNNCRRNRIE